MMWPGATDTWPTANWRQCNGSTLSQTTYPDLFSIIGYTYGGSGDNFNLPNLQNNFIVGAGDGYNLNATGGSADATIVEHAHEVRSTNYSVNPGLLTINDPGHTHVLQGSFVDESTERSKGNIVDDDRSNSIVNEQHTAPGATRSFTDISISGSTQPAGNPATNANLPPYVGLYYIIRIQ